MNLIKLFISNDMNLILYIKSDDSLIKESAEKYHEEWATILKNLGRF